MKKALKVAVAASVLATPALAFEPGAPDFRYSNMENPLFAPTAGQFYTSLGAGLMIKKADHTDAMVAKGHAGATEFPIYRGSAGLGYGITDRLSLNGKFGYTNDPDISRKGMSLGRLGLNYRVFEGLATDGWVWDVYADAHLGGISQMTGAYTPKGFNYDNYSNGRWGFYAGTKVGKTWGNFTAAVFGELLQTFGNHNNSINLTPTKTAAAASLTALGGNPSNQASVPTAIGNCVAAGLGTVAECTAMMSQAFGMANLPDEASVNLKSTLEWNLGLQTFYEIDSRWSVGGAFTYKHHADNGVTSVATAPANAVQAQTFESMVNMLSNMEDGFDEYIIGLSAAHKFTDTVQVALYGEYTFDTAHRLSQNGTDLKAEVGVRVNMLF